MLHTTTAKFNTEGYWGRSILEDYKPTSEDVNLFDQNGYDLTEIEKKYAVYNNVAYSAHREHRAALKQERLVQEYHKEGSILNHSLLFERKGYCDCALEQLGNWANQLPLL